MFGKDDKKCTSWLLYLPSNLIVKYRLEGTFRNLVWQEGDIVIPKKQAQKQGEMRKYSSGQNSPHLKIFFFNIKKTF